MKREVILMTKVKNEFKKRGHDNLEFHLRNISVNGEKRGCSGFILNKENGKIVYLTTEPVYDWNSKVMYRTAKDLKDYTGGTNNWVEPEYMYEAIMGLLS